MPPNRTSLMDPKRREGEGLQKEVASVGVMKKTEQSLPPMSKEHKRNEDEE
jgi:hypothetical protein